LKTTQKSMIKIVVFIQIVVLALRNLATFPDYCIS